MEAVQLLTVLSRAIIKQITKYFVSKFILRDFEFFGCRMNLIVELHAIRLPALL